MQVANRLAALQNNADDAENQIDLIISGQLIQILKTTRYYGELLLQLPRRFDGAFQGAIGITWSVDRIVIMINPNRFCKANFTADQLDLVLKQIALHLTFAHPLMYPRVNQLNQLACDLVVDQYLDDRLLAQVNFQFGLNLPDQMGSHYYLTQLARIKPSNQQSSQRQVAALMHKRRQKYDAHSGWQAFNEQERALQRGQLQQMVNRAWRQTPTKQRGTMPGNVVAAIDHDAKAPKIKDWRHLLQVGLGMLPFEKQDSRARFNRRQGYRMELAGQISNTIRRINIFVDNSGSMGDQEISRLLNEISRFLNQTAALVTIYSFDSVIHFKASYHANNGHQIKYQRNGGGGTSFQAIFDFMNSQRNKFNDTLTIIMTDGHGEKSINAHDFKNIVWILTTPVNEFSLRNSFPGRMISIDSKR